MANKIVLTILTLFTVLISITATSVSACTVFTASQDDTILVANNEDWFALDSYIRYYPASNGHHGAVFFGFADDLWLQGGMNEEGLFFDFTTLPPVQVESHPEKVEIKNNVALVALQSCSTVEEVIQLYNNTRFFNTWSGQLLYADASGDAVVISIDTDGELAYTRKEGKYLIMTNFNVVNPDNGRYPCNRYTTAQEMLEDMDNVTADGFQSILSAVHQESAFTNTVYSNIYDLQNGDIYLYYFHQFEEVVKINLAEELAKGERVIPLIDLFSRETRNIALAEYRAYQLRAFVAEVISITALVTDIACLTILAVKLVKRRKETVSRNGIATGESSNERILPLILLVSLAWTLTFWTYPLLTWNKVYNFIYGLYEVLLPLPEFIFLLLGLLGPLIAISAILKSTTIKITK
ncbi:MAG: carcinine hydrolase/isopenicillin-N N-acyltransferase family protein [Candidatus Odinarchaeota archaeon]